MLVKLLSYLTFLLSMSQQRLQLCWNNRVIANTTAHMTWSQQGKVIVYFLLLFVHYYLVWDQVQTIVDYSIYTPCMYINRCCNCLLEILIPFYCY